MRFKLSGTGLHIPLITFLVVGRRGDRGDSLFQRDPSTVQAAGIILSVPWNIGAAAVVLGRKAFSPKGCEVHSSSHSVTVT